MTGITHLLVDLGSLPGDGLEYELLWRLLLLLGIALFLSFASGLPLDRNELREREARARRTFGPARPGRADASDRRR